MSKGRIYIAGPMRGIEDYNFPAFDEARDVLKADGWDVVSPADLDRQEGLNAFHDDQDWNELPEGVCSADFAERDLNALLTCDAIYMLPGWQDSRGASAERAVARWIDLEVLGDVGAGPASRYSAIAPPCEAIATECRDKCRDTAAARKQRPIASGVLDYFPDAIAAVAHCSWVGNEQHNPGEPLHWSRHKSNDHADCMLRHFMDRGTVDSDGVRHTTKVAWRALALLQLELEEQKASE